MRSIGRWLCGIMPQPSCWLLMLLIVGQTVYADPSESTTLAPLTIKARDRDHQAEVHTTANSTAFATPISQLDDEEQALTIFRTPRAGRYERQVEEDQVDRCRLFVEGDPTKNELYSPEYPNLYPKNINCTRVITAPKGQIIRLDFRNSFNIEAKEECKFDFLEIRDGQYGFSTLIGKFCGTDFPPEITSKERYLWLHFHSDDTIEYTGFSAVYEYLDRNREAPSTDLNCTIEKDGYEGFINSTDVPADIREQVIRDKIALDCIWRIQVKDNWKIFLKFLDFHLSKPNDCETNFLDIFPEQTVMPLRVKNFCGSAGESITAESNILHMRFYAEQSAINSTFAILYTAFRDRGTGTCTDDEYDCEDATCISSDLKCNERDNCKFRWDEEKCSSETTGQSEHVVIIIIVFGLILGGMVITFIVNCIRKIIRDQKIIRDVPALRDSVYHIDSFVLGAPKSAIFVGLQNDFMCDFAYNLENEQRNQLEQLEQLQQQQHSNEDYNDLEQSNLNSSSNSNRSDCSRSSQKCKFEAPQQVAPLGGNYDCDSNCDYAYECDSNNGPEQTLAYDDGCHYELQPEQLDEQLQPEQQQHQQQDQLEEDEEEHEEEEEEEEDEDDEYDDGIGFSCDSDSATVPEDDEFVLVAGHCMPITSGRLELPSSSNSYTSSLQCSTPTGTACSSSTSTETDAILPELTPPPPPPPPPPSAQLHQSKLKAKKGLKFFNKII
ncbi:neuropilin and tolloid-like protein 2 isoform X2 [Drosophila virilis]|uniref:Uncharacterized protein, isoform B n=1 Tax=Drosophila virilis TaxID=7244 RepID=B4M2J9_DROVI|nr:neuropilin and tolloid-like protein 2 isoform X2 [Drosophila virilis]EDW65903.2 uncharacterized protein Dvir_GJ18639, isoform B [Drosophila virilis]KRF82467.1 uncharacterized protein Dvir_GJ18639, isoform C [Drosophila virilis]KRF82468.1 uncharacterized protein Dvir_GJ18639, isoform D [Drosophila virilis]